MTRRRWGRVGAAWVTLLALAACGGGGPDGVAPSSTANPPAPAPTTASATPPLAVSTSAPPASPSAGSTPPGAPSFTIVAGGDVLLHEPTWAQAALDAAVGAYDFAPQLAAIAPEVGAADLALCHLETPLAPAGGPYQGYPSFSGPPEIAAGLAATGFDACSLASNHTWDQGAAGIERSAATLEASGITPYGAAAGGRPGNPTLVETADLTVGLLSYTYGHNASPGDGSVETIDLADALADAQAARAAGADLVVASVHWGTEYANETNAQQRDLAPALLASPDIDLVLGHHAHVVQPFERIGGEWVAYGMGNMLAAHATELPANQEGVLARFTFTQGAAGWQVTEAAYLPVMVDRGPPLRMVDLPTALAGQLPGASRDRYGTALSRTREVVRGLPGGAELVEIGPRGS